jgi:hypothetical protein
MITTDEIIMIKQAISTIALENNWDKAKQKELFNEAVSEIVKHRTKSNKKKRSNK